MSAIGTGWLILLNLFVYREPTGERGNKPIGKVFTEMLSVLTDFRFIVMIVIYSGFWIMYFQIYDSVLWYLTEKVDMTPFNRVVNQILSLFVSNPDWKYEAEHVTAMNAGAIILLQLLVSGIVRKTKALPTMIVGIALGSVGMGMLAIAPMPGFFYSPCSYLPSGR